jgi:hypothetical protein
MRDCNFGSHFGSCRLLISFQGGLEQTADEKWFMDFFVGEEKVYEGCARTEWEFSAFDDSNF